ncbi:hypothetical protein, partial [Bacillus cereus group sp. TH204-1LC]|uniref:hypothetical protein n=1 Tax=Bacillus cereus group sp. TH204-1LC TaxID=3018054 RepID=UPI003FA415FB
KNIRVIREVNGTGKRFIPFRRQCEAVINLLFRGIRTDFGKVNDLQEAWHWPSFYNVVTGKTLALPNLIALQHIPLSPAGVIAKRPAPIALPNSCAA